jgi:hypothetical protein
MHRLAHSFSATPPQSPAIFQAVGNPVAVEVPMFIELKTKRRWIVSILEAVAEHSEGRVLARATIKHNGIRSYSSGEKSLTSRLKAVTRPMANAGR